MVACPPRAGNGPRGPLPQERGEDDPAEAPGIASHRPGAVPPVAGLPAASSALADSLGASPGPPVARGDRATRPWRPSTGPSPHPTRRGLDGTRGTCDDRPP